ncbi:MAG: TlyA family RNA methyltransferase, partial [Microcoleus sp.]
FSIRCGNSWAYDCLLQAGATLVYGVDVGYGQADWRLRNDPRVILKERTNLRYMTAAELYGESPRADLAVVDVSFISLDKVLPALWELLAAPKEAVLLVKPQFEVGRERVGKKGVVRDSATQADAIFQVWKAARALGWQELGLTWSPLLGPAGNIEYLLWLGIDREPEPDESAILSVGVAPVGAGCANEEGVVKERILEVAKAAARELVNRL